MAPYRQHSIPDTSFLAQTSIQAHEELRFLISSLYEGRLERGLQIGKEKVLPEDKWHLETKLYPHLIWP